MKRLDYLYAIAAIALSACSGDYSVDTRTIGGDEPVAIEFDAASNRAHTRADMAGAAAATALNNQFHVYGVKTVDGTDRTVYPNYVVEYDGTDGAGAANSTDSNTRGWEYVGLNNYPNQTLHYWDYSASNFMFQAWSHSTGNATVAVTGKNTLTITATSADELAKVYVADLVDIDKTVTPAAGINVYGGIVTFTFRSMATRVRFGMYETISGYTVSKMTFRSPNGLFATSNSNALLEGSFNGQDSSAGGTYNVTYDATTKKAVVDNTAAGITARYYDFGTFSQDAIGINRSNPTWAGGTPIYQQVLPNEDHAGDMTLYVDFVLTAEDGSGDIIKVTGAHVTVPASKMIWHPNHAYTYLFRITKDVNGTTGDEGTDPEKLYPITFDAIVTEFDETTPPVVTELKDP